MFFLPAKLKLKPPPNRYLSFAAKAVHQRPAHRRLPSERSAIDDVAGLATRARERCLAHRGGGRDAFLEVVAIQLAQVDDPANWREDDLSRRYEPYATLVLDAEDDLRPIVLDEEVEDLLAGIAQLVGEYVLDRKRESPRTGPSPPEGARSGWEKISVGGGCLVLIRKLRDPSDRPETPEIVSAIEAALKSGFWASRPF